MKFSISKKMEEDMQNHTTRYLAEYIEKEQISKEDISKKLHIPVIKLFPGTQENLTADEFLKLCGYLHIDPKKIPWYGEIIE